MRKETVIVPAVVCKECGRSKVSAQTESQYFCDNCGKKLKWNSYYGTPSHLAMYHHGCKCGQSIPEWDFCNINCTMSWFRTKMRKAVAKHGPHPITQENYKHLELILHMKDLLDLARRIKP